MTANGHALVPLATRLTARANLTDDDRDALFALSYQDKRVDTGGYIAQEGDSPSLCRIILSGFAHRHRFTAQGMRQIIAIHGQGDVLNFPSSPPVPAEDFVQALTPVRVAIVAMEDMLDLGRRCPRIANALLVEMNTEISTIRAWVANMGRRDARGRIAHLLCELALRTDPAGGRDGCVAALYLTQSELADATGMTTVHVNRTLRALEEETYIQRQRRRIMIPNWSRLAALADFRSSPWTRRITTAE